MKKTIIVTGGAGFIGSHVVRRLVNKYPDYKIVNLDALTYAGNLENLKDVENAPNYMFEHADIRNAQQLKEIFEKHQPQGVIHLAAESHVDRSISDPMTFIETNIVGTTNLLMAAKQLWNGQYEDKCFYHVSTDEVYGSLGEQGLFREDTSYDPRSPYSASKASSDHLVRSYFHTYDMPIVISNCSNNYGPNHFPEKLIPLAIHRIQNNQEIPIYGKGENVRDWLYVEDHAAAIDVVFHKGKMGETYNIGGNNEWTNIDLIRLLCQIMDAKLGNEKGTAEKLITFVKDRAGHDARYAIDSTKIKTELGWEPSLTFEEGLPKTVDWYLENQAWLRSVTSGAYQNYYKQQYQDR